MNRDPNEPLPIEVTTCAICGEQVGDEPRVRFVVKHVHTGRMHLADMNAWLEERERGQR